MIEIENFVEEEETQNYNEGQSDNLLNNNTLMKNLDNF